MNRHPQNTDRDERTEGSLPTPAKQHAAEESVSRQRDDESAAARRREDEIASARQIEQERVTQTEQQAAQEPVVQQPADPYAAMTEQTKRLDQERADRERQDRERQDRERGDRNRQDRLREERRAHEQREHALEQKAALTQIQDQEYHDAREWRESRGYAEERFRVGDNDFSGSFDHGDLEDRTAARLGIERERQERAQAAQERTERIERVVERVTQTIDRTVDRAKDVAERFVDRAREFGDRVMQRVQVYQLDHRVTPEREIDITPRRDERALKTNDTRGETERQPVEKLTEEQEIGEVRPRVDPEMSHRDEERLHHDDEAMRDRRQQAESHPAADQGTIEHDAPDHGKSQLALEIEAAFARVERERSLARDDDRGPSHSHSR